MSHCAYDVATRNLLWQNEREEKIRRLREEEQKEREKKENCTYSPSLCPYKGDNAPNLSRFGKEGIANYFERVSGGRRVSSKSTLNNKNKENRLNGINIPKDI
ncbi:MAG: hypothetical protein KDD45_00335 [Bdellovibrionales bacterium]|nr:hypothetical protein [Bdellovibrionales bacterium]